MSWFQNLTSAISGGNSSSTQSSQSGNSDASTFDNTGAPVPSGGPVPPSDSGNPSSGNNGGNNESTKSQTVEELLFAPISPAPAPTTQEDKNSEKNKVTEGEIAPGLTTQKLVQNLQSVNFLGTVPEETVTAALGGDTAAFSKVISSVAQLSAAIAVQQSISANKALLDQRFTEFDGTLTNKIGESKYADVLNAPEFSSPFIRPLAENLVTRLRERDSSITPDQIKQVLPSLIQHAMKSTTFNTQAPAPTNKSNSKTRATEVNLDELFG